MNKLLKKLGLISDNETAIETRRRILDKATNTDSKNKWASGKEFDQNKVTVKDKAKA